MTVTYTPNLGIKQIDIGGEVDTWGADTNANWQRVEDAIAGVLTLSVSGTVTLTQTFDTTDQSHFAVINVTGGSGGTLVLPAIPGLHCVRNGTPGDLTVTNAGAGANGTVLHAGCSSQIFNDGVSAVYQTGFGGSLKDYIDNIALSAKNYTDQAAIAASNGQFPGQSGNAGKYFQTNGSIPSWVQPQVSDIAGLQTLINNTKSFAIAVSALL